MFKSKHIELETVANISELTELFKEFANDLEYRANICPNYISFDTDYKNTWNKEYFLIKYKMKLAGYLLIDVYRYDRTASITVALKKTYRKIGIGLYSTFLACQYIFDFLGLEKIETTVFEYNGTSLKINHKFMKLEGCRRKTIYWKGKYWDKYLFGLLKEEYKELIKSKYFKFLTK